MKKAMFKVGPYKVRSYTIGPYTLSNPDDAQDLLLDYLQWRHEHEWHHGWGYDPETDPFVVEMREVIRKLHP